MTLKRQKTLRGWEKLVTFLRQKTLKGLTVWEPYSNFFIFLVCLQKINDEKGS